MNSPTRVVYVMRKKVRDNLNETCFDSVFTARQIACNEKS